LLLALQETFVAVASIGRGATHEDGHGDVALQPGPAVEMKFGSFKDSTAFVSFELFLSHFRAEMPTVTA
jgi:hypothetical protein